jgi:hypothetical protein
MLYVKLMLRKVTASLEKRLRSASYYLRHFYLSEDYFPKRNGLVKNLDISRFPFYESRVSYSETSLCHFSVNRLLSAMSSFTTMAPCSIKKTAQSTKLGVSHRSHIGKCSLFTNKWVKQVSVS